MFILSHMPPIQFNSILFNSFPSILIKVHILFTYIGTISTYILVRSTYLHCYLTKFKIRKQIQKQNNANNLV